MKPRHITTEDELRRYEANVKKIKVGGGESRLKNLDAGGGSRGTGSRLPVPTSLRARSKSAPSPLTLALTGQLPSGKNQVQLLFRNGEVQKYPNKTFTNWRAKAYVEILEQADWGSRTIITTPIHLTVEYWTGDARTRDVSGQLDALFHLLVYAKVLKDDGLVHEITWRRQPMNRKFPKVLMTIEVLP